jgi:hypothetical protein
MSHSTISKGPLGLDTCIERKFYSQLLLEYALASDADIILYLMVLAALALGDEAIPKQNDILLIDFILDNICWLLYKIQEYCIIIEDIALDDKGFIKTGPDLSSENFSAEGWPLTRQPYLLETSLPGIFAVGDVRGGSIKRVACAVGEGSIAVSFVHKVLQE